jgi:hypothetical protein
MLRSLLLLGLLGSRGVNSHRKSLCLFVEEVRMESGTLTGAPPPARYMDAMRPPIGNASAGGL